MTSFLKALVFELAKFLLRTAMDKALAAEIKRGIKVAEQSGLKDQDKMRVALDSIKASGIEALKKETESTLRTKVEEALDRYF